MIRTQQESIDIFKQMLSQLRKDKKKPKAKLLLRSLKANEGKGELIFCKY